MSVKLLTENHFEFLSLKKEIAQARLSIHLLKWHIVGNHMSWHVLILYLIDDSIVWFLIWTFQQYMVQWNGSEILTTRWVWLIPAWSVSLTISCVCSCQGITFFTGILNYHTIIRDTYVTTRGCIRRLTHCKMPEIK